MFNPKWEKRAKRVAVAVGAVGMGITVAVIPFVLPALRRYCLPYIPATPSQIKGVCDVMKGRRGTVVDLGSGDGRVVIALAKQGHHVVGIELNYLLILVSRVSAFVNGVGKNTEFHKKDIWKVDLSQFDNILFFGVEQMMKPLGDKIKQEAPPTAHIVSCRFKFPQWTAYCYSNDTGPNSIWTYNNPYHHGNNKIKI